jgi:hypothetical protein
MLRKLRVFDSPIILVYDDLKRFWSDDKLE